MMTAKTKGKAGDKVRADAFFLLCSGIALSQHERDIAGYEIYSGKRAD